MIYQLITGLIQKALEVELIEAADQIYVRNQVMSLLELETFPDEEVEPYEDTIPNLVEKIILYAARTRGYRGCI